MTARKKVSIIIPCFNDGALLEEALGSVKRCDPGLCEVIVVNDGSTDEATLEILRRIEKETCFVLHQPNGGLATARNNGIRFSTGEYVLPLDADNLIRPQYSLEGVRAFKAHSSVGVVYADRMLFGDQRKRLRIREFDLSWLLMANFIDACAMFRREVWEQCGGYDTKMPVQGYEDWDLWIRIAALDWKFHHLPIIGFDYRVRKDSMSTTMTPKVVQVREYLTHKHSSLYAAEYYKFGLWETPAREFRRRPGYVLSQLIVKGLFPAISKRLWEVR